MSVQEERIPEALGPYRLRQRLGEGGMGVVYLASDPGQQLVAVKVLRRGVPGEAMSRRRLAREFETMRRVHSPFVAQVIDADVESTPPYIVTRYVPGRTLEDQVTKDGPLSGPGLLRLARGLASALTAVHAAGVVHRDLKPANVMIVEGEPVVIDFGIAQAPDSTRLTMTGMFMGTPGYLAPEVIEGSPSGPAADVHSWAATLAFAATGRPPFGTGSFETIFYRIINGQPDLAAMPAPLMPMVLHALARDPARRPSAAELADRVGCLDPAALRPSEAPTIPPRPGLSGPAGATMGDVSARPVLAGMAGGAAAAALPAVRPAPPAPVPARGWSSGTSPLAARPPDNYADLLPPVSYRQPLAQPGLGQPGVAGPGSAPPWSQPSASPADGRGRSAARPRSSRPLLVLAVVVALVAVAVLLPVAGTVAVLLFLALLRSVDVSGSWLGRRRSRQGASAADPIAFLAYLPFAALRSVLGVLLTLPLGLLVAAAAAAATYVVLPGHPLARAGSYAAGALIACCALAPGSGRSRKPLSTFFGAITTTAPSAVLVSVGVIALGVAAAAAALSLPPAFWPVHHVGLSLTHLPFVSGLLHHFSLSRLATRLGL
jgi:Protein kinase domain